jgi:hypothetical protein
MNASRLRSASALWIAVTLAACDPTRLIGPANQLEVSNNPGIFEWQVTALRNVSQTLTYDWQNPGTTANVNQASSVTSGTATLTVLDASGAQVYTRNLAENGTFNTSTGATGAWTVTVELDKVHGTLNFRLDTP